MRMIVAVEATSETAVRTVCIQDNNVIGIVDDRYLKETYAIGQMMDIIMMGPALLTAQCKKGTVSGETISWTNSPAKMGDVLSVADDGSIRINDSTAKPNKVIGKVKSVEGTNFYEIMVGVL
ncbi:hypothetical protein J3E07_001577 [Methanococcus voltae]|uniref:Uncharacterized protein n=1 Tax=Methanococcus voltae TaxID=2188 RepID=A0A8J7RJP6_METVO|nr:hypothetical protein [Methanococcus voltae]MBP2202136.1 hypothetical protein [Methanococcus voltae]